MNNFPAFPFPYEQVNTHGGVTRVRSNPGMSLRDWFAGQALAGILANPGTGGAGPEVIARLATAIYVVADAMLAERDKKSTP